MRAYKLCFITRSNSAKLSKQTYSWWSWTHESVRRLFHRFDSWLTKFCWNLIQHQLRRNTSQLELNRWLADRNCIGGKSVYRFNKSFKIPNTISIISDCAKKHSQSQWAWRESTFLSAHCTNTMQLNEWKRLSFWTRSTFDFETKRSEYLMSYIEGSDARLFKACDTSQTVARLARKKGRVCIWPKDSEDRLQYNLSIRRTEPSSKMSKNLPKIISSNDLQLLCVQIFASPFRVDLEIQSA